MDGARPHDPECRERFKKLLQDAGKLPPDEPAVAVAADPNHAALPPDVIPGADLGEATESEAAVSLFGDFSQSDAEGAAPNGWQPSGSPAAAAGVRSVARAVDAVLRSTNTSLKDSDNKALIKAMTSKVAQIISEA